MSLQREPLVPHRSFYCEITVQSCHGKDLEQVGPFYINVLTANVERLSGGAADQSLFQYRNVRWKAEGVQLVFLLKSVSL